MCISIFKCNYSELFAPFANASIYLLWHKE